MLVFPLSSYSCPETWAPSSVLGEPLHQRKKHSQKVSEHPRVTGKATRQSKHSQAIEAKSQGREAPYAAKSVAAPLQEEGVHVLPQPASLEHVLNRLQWLERESSNLRSLLSTMSETAQPPVLGQPMPPGPKVHNPPVFITHLSQ